MNLKPEEKVEIKIGFWLQENGCQVSFNRNSKKFDNIIPNYNIFKTKGVKSKPDMIFFNPYNRTYNIIELKDASQSINIRRSIKIIDYYSDYVNNKVQYFIEDKKINIKHFLVGTINSPKGHLFEDEFNELIDNRTSNNSGKIWACRHHIIPFFEYRRTHEFIRDLWQNWARAGKNEKVGIGLLLSDILDKETKEEILGKEGKPAIFSEIHNNRWVQYWFKIK